MRRQAHLRVGVIVRFRPGRVRQWPRQGQGSGLGQGWAWGAGLGAGPGRGQGQQAPHARAVLELFSDVQLLLHGSTHRVLGVCVRQGVSRCWCAALRSKMLMMEVYGAQGTFEETRSMSALINAIPEIGPWLVKLFDLDPSANDAQIFLGVRRTS